MLGIERRRKIMERLVQDRKIYVSDLSRFFNVTEETIRRDLEKLEGQNLLRRSYGGAVLNEHTNNDLSFVKRRAIHSADRETIAQKAAALIHDGDTIMIDSSTTCLALLPQLRSRKNLTIITNSVRLVNDFVNSPFTLISSGGVLRPHSFALTGSTACDTLRKYFVELAFISCKGLEPQKGLMESNEEESKVKEIMLAQSRKAILLADHSKFGKTAFIRTCEFGAIAELITDMDPGDSWREFLTSQQIRLTF